MATRGSSIVVPAESAALPSLAAATGLLGALCAVMLPDGVDTAMSSTLHLYLMGTFLVTPDEAAWISILYFASKLYALLLAVRVQERFGQKHALLAASALLVAATAASLWAAGYQALLVLRVLQGIGGGLVLALGQGALLTMFAHRRQPLVQAIFALAAVVFPVSVVPALLGYYAYQSDWRIPFGLTALVGTGGCIWLFWRRELLSERRVRTSVPVVRIILMATLLLCVTYVLQQGNRYAWIESSTMVRGLVLGALCLACLIFAETDGRPTCLRYQCFRHADFTFGMCVSLLAGTALFASSFTIPAFVGSVLAYPVWQNGWLQMQALGCAALSILTVGLVLRFTRFPAFLFIVLGLVLFATAMWSLGEVPSSVDSEGVKPWIMMRGLALGGLFLPLTIITLTAVPAAEAVAASGLFNFGRQLGGLIGIAWIQTLETHLAARNQTVFGQALSSLNPLLSQFARGAQDALHGPIQTINALLVREAFRQFHSVAFNGCFASVAMLFAFAFPVVVTIRLVTARLLGRSPRIDPQP